MGKLPRKKFIAEDEKADLDILLHGVDPAAHEFEAYSRAVRYVSDLQGVLVAGAPQAVLQRKVTIFALMASKRFITLLEQRDPRAMVITAYWTAMMKFAEEGWWLRGMAETETNGLASLVPQEWQWAMAWPLQMINRESDGKVCRSFQVQVPVLTELPIA